MKNAIFNDYCSTNIVSKCHFHSFLITRETHSTCQKVSATKKKDGGVGTQTEMTGELEAAF